MGQRDVGAWVNFASAPTPHGFGQQFVDAAALQVGERGLSWRGGGVGHERGSGMAETFLNPFHIENKQKRFDDNTTYHLRAAALKERRLPSFSIKSVLDRLNQPFFVETAQSPGSRARVAARSPPRARVSVSAPGMHEAWTRRRRHSPNAVD